MRFRCLVLVVAALVLAALGGCYKKSDHSPTEPLASSVITLSSSSGATSLPADGFSRLRLEARLSGDPAFANRTVVFATTAGTLSGGTAGTNCTGCVNVAADGSGIARIDLISTQQVGSATVTASPAAAPGILASLTVDFVAANPDDTVRFVAAPDRAPADGATLSTFTVALSPSVPTASRQVTFAATAGTFVPPNPVNADAGNRASADLQSPRTITSARVTATVNGVTREVPIRFERALPKIITVNANPAVAPPAAGTTIQITATLIRDQGIVTDGTVVTFRAARADDGTPVGGFTNVTTSTNGTATATFLPRTTTPGTVIVTVGAQDTSVTGTVQIDLTGS